LGAACSRLLVIDPEELWFDGTLQGAVILFAEKKNHPGHDCEGVGIVQVSGRSFVAGDPSSLFDHAERINGKTVEGKWTRALLSASERELFDALSGHNQVHRFDEVAKVDVGIVTGANKFLGGVSAAALGMAGWGTALDAKSFFRTALVTVGRAYPDAEGSRSARLPDSPNQ